MAYSESKWQVTISESYIIFYLKAYSLLNQINFWYSYMKYKKLRIKVAVKEEMFLDNGGTT